MPAAFSFLDALPLDLAKFLQPQVSVPGKAELVSAPAEVRVRRLSRIVFPAAERAYFITSLLAHHRGAAAWTGEKWGAHHVLA